MSDLTAAQMSWKGWAHFNQPLKTAPRILKWIGPFSQAHHDYKVPFAIVPLLFVDIKNPVYSHLPNKRATHLLTIQFFMPPTRPY